MTLATALTVSPGCKAGSGLPFRQWTGGEGAAWAPDLPTRFFRPAQAGGSLPKPRLWQGCAEALVERGGDLDGVQLRRDTPKRRQPGLPLGADRAGFDSFGASNQHRPLPQGGGPFYAVITLCRDQHTAGYLLPAPINTHCRTVAWEPLPMHRGSLLVRHGIVIPLKDVRPWRLSILEAIIISGDLTRRR